MSRPSRPQAFSAARGRTDLFGGMNDMALSANAVMERAGLTPRFSGIWDPSQTIMLS